MTFVNLKIQQLSFKKFSRLGQFTNIQNSKKTFVQNLNQTILKKPRKQKSKNWNLNLQ